MTYTLDDVAEELVSKKKYTLNDVDTQGVSKIKSASIGAAQGASMGFGDEGSAMVVSLAKKLMAKGGTFEENYVRARDALRGKILEAKEANPKTYMAGEFAGGMATTPLAGGTPTAARLAALGMIQGLGSSDADLTRGDVGGAAKGVAVGGVVGAAMKPVAAGAGVLARGAGKLINPEWLQSVARMRALRSLGFSKGQVKTPEALEVAKKTGQTMLDEGVIKWNADPEDMAGGVSDIIERKGKDIGAFLKNRGNGIEASSMIGALNKVRPVDAEGRWLRGGEYDKINKIIDSAIDTVRAHGDLIPFEDANRLKGVLQNVVNWTSGRTEQETGKRIAGAARQSIDDTLESRAKSVADPYLTFRDKYSSPEEATKRVEQFFKDKEVYGAAQHAQDALANRLSSDVATKDFGLTDTMVAAANPNVGGAAAILAKKGYERFGNQAIAHGADAASKKLYAIGDKIPEFLKTAPQKLGKYAAMLGAAARQGAQAVTVRHFVLSNTDPEYRIMIRELENQDPGQVPAEVMP